MLAAVLLVGALSGAAPEGHPVHAIVYDGAVYDVFLNEAEGRYAISVCARYVPTGSRLEHNTCGNASAGSVVSIRSDRDHPLLIDYHATYSHRAKRLEKAGNALVNGTSSPETFWAALVKQLKRSPRMR
ncbi:MAG: hypothetical protein AAF658_16515 [Myxococcota bacterium]